MKKCIRLRDTELVKEARLQLINVPEVGIRSVVDPWHAVLDEGKKMGFPEIHHFACIIESARPQQRHLLPSALMNEVTHCIAHCELWVEDDAQDLTASACRSLLADHVRGLLRTVEGDAAPASPIV